MSTETDVEQLLENFQKALDALNNIGNVEALITNLDANRNRKLLKKVKHVVGEVHNKVGTVKEKVSKAYKRVKLLSSSESEDPSVPSYTDKDVSDQGVDRLDESGNVSMNIDEGRYSPIVGGKRRHLKRSTKHTDKSQKNKGINSLEESNDISNEQSKESDSETDNIVMKKKVSSEENEQRMDMDDSEADNVVNFEDNQNQVDAIDNNDDQVGEITNNEDTEKNTEVDNSEDVIDGTPQKPANILSLSLKKNKSIEETIQSTNTANSQEKLNQSKNMADNDTENDRTSKKLHGKKKGASDVSDDEEENLKVSSKRFAGKESKDRSSDDNPEKVSEKTSSKTDQPKNNVDDKHNSHKADHSSDNATNPASDNEDNTLSHNEDNSTSGKEANPISDSEANPTSDNEDNTMDDNEVNPTSDDKANPLSDNEANPISDNGSEISSDVITIEDTPKKASSEKDKNKNSVKDSSDSDPEEPQNDTKDPFPIPKIKLVDINKLLAPNKKPLEVRITSPRTKKSVTFDSSVIILSSSDEETPKKDPKNKNQSPLKSAMRKSPSKKADNSDSDSKENNENLRNRRATRQTRTENKVVISDHSSDDSDFEETRRSKRLNRHDTAKANLKSRFSALASKNSERKCKAVATRRLRDYEEHSDTEESCEKKKRNKNKKLNSDDNDSDKDSKEVTRIRNKKRRRKKDILETSSLSDHSDNSDGSDSEVAVLYGNKPVPKSKVNLKKVKVSYPEPDKNDPKFRTGVFVSLPLFKCEELPEIYKRKKELFEIKKLTKMDFTRRTRSARNGSSKKSDEVDNPDRKRIKLTLRLNRKNKLKEDSSDDERSSIEENKDGDVEKDDEQEREEAVFGLGPADEPDYAGANDLLAEECLEQIKDNSDKEDSDKQGEHSDSDKDDGADKKGKNKKKKGGEKNKKHKENRNKGSDKESTKDAKKGSDEKDMEQIKDNSDQEEGSDKQGEHSDSDRDNCAEKKRKNKKKKGGEKNKKNKDKENSNEVSDEESTKDAKKGSDEKDMDEEPKVNGVGSSSDDGSDGSQKDDKKEKKGESSDEEDDDKKKKKKWKNDKLLNQKIDSSDSDEDFAKCSKKKDKSNSSSVRKAKRRLKKSTVLSDSDSDNEKKKKGTGSGDDDDEDDYKADEKSSNSSSGSEKEDNSEESEKEGKKKPARKRIKRVKDSSSDDDDKSTRKHIRRMIDRDSLSDTTKKAEQDEKSRKARIADKQKKYNQIFDLKADATVETVVLDFDEKTEEPLLSVSKKLAKQLKPHQVLGIKFMWDACFESITRLKKNAGSGCILAHCMGLGKTLQVITLSHTLLTNSKKTGVEKILVVCPVNTVLNWKSEFKKWIPRGIEFEVYELVSCKSSSVNHERNYIVKEWHENGGVLIIGYNMFRTLSNPENKTIPKKIRASFQEGLVDPGPDLVVCDEGHLLKNEKTNLSIAMNRIKTPRRIVLTGTPLQNNLKEYWCMVQFIKPNLLGTYKEYMNRFVNPIINGQYTDSTQHDIAIMRRRSHVLHKLLDGVVQRQDYSVLEPYLPPKYEYVLFLRLTEVQKKLYTHYMDNFAKRGDGSNRTSFLFTDFQQFQRICTHPRVLLDKSIEDREKKDINGEESESEGSLRDFIDDEESECSSSDSDRSGSRSGSDCSIKSDEKKKKKGKKARRNRVTRAQAALKRDNGEGSDSEEEITTPKEWWQEYIDKDELDNINHSAKIFLLFEILKECEEIGDKVLLFSQSLYTLNCIEYFLQRITEATRERDTEAVGGHSGTWFIGLDYFRLDGSSSCDNRASWCDEFNDPDNTRARLFLISTKAGGLGINLVAANRVIIFDVSWNPSHDVQSIYRVYRFGQTKPSYVYRFVAYGAMEMKIYERQVTKQAISKRVIDEQQIDRHYSQNDIQELYKTDLEPTDRPIPMVPKDVLLGEMLQKYENTIFKYHEHQSLLENKQDEELNEEERKAAWDEFENEKVIRKTTFAPNFGGINPAAFQNQMNFSPQLIQVALANIVRKDNPTWSEIQIRGILPALVTQLQMQMSENDLSMYNRVQQEIRLMQQLQAQRMHEQYLQQYQLQQILQKQQLTNQMLGNLNVTPEELRRLQTAASQNYIPPSSSTAGGSGDIIELND